MSVRTFLPGALHCYDLICIVIVYRLNQIKLTEEKNNEVKRGTSYDNKCLSVLNLFFSQVISNNLRLDKGTETGYMATIHSYLRQQGDASC